MLIRRVKVENYKAFNRPQEFELGSGFNVIVGSNDSGKTALLEALSCSFEHKPYRSLATSPAPEAEKGRPSLTELEFSVSREELYEITSRTRHILHICTGTDPNRTSEPGQCLQRILDRADMQCRLRISKTQGSEKILPLQLLYESGSLPSEGQQVYVIRVNPSSGHLRAEGVEQTSFPSATELSMHVFTHSRPQIYRFLAERKIPFRYNSGPNDVLTPDAVNLAQVLHYMQGIRKRMQRYNDLVRRVFPHIHHITTIPHTSDECEIRVWTGEVEHERPDLSFLLSESGTGVGQVLAMLYLVFTATSPRVILIDEPNTFLNPGAARALISILHEYSQHQYIVSTHSPSLMDAARPSFVHLLSWTEEGTVAQRCDLSLLADQRLLLREVGVSLADVFGSERVLWVEGPTEEKCFPEILRHYGILLDRTAIIGVLTTGAFDRKDATMVVQIYEKLTEGAAALLPSVVRFLFDREGRQALAAENHGRKGLRFLPLRMFENYLLFPSAVADFMNTYRAECDGTWPQITTVAVAQLWEGSALAKGYSRELCTAWRENTDGAKLIDITFWELSGETLQYDKATHCLQLTKAVLSQHPDALRVLADLITDVLSSPV